MCSLSVIWNYTVQTSALSQATNSGITISPPSQKVVISPGLLQADIYVKVTNNNDYVFIGQVKLLDFQALDQNGGVSLEQAGAKFGLANWMSLAGSSSIQLGEGQTEVLKVLIDNRSDLSPGGHYGAIAITTSPSNNLKNNVVGFNQQLVSLVFLNKSGGDVNGLQLNGITPEQWSGGLPLSIQTVFKNTGNVYEVPHGYIEIFDPHGTLVRHGIINPQATLIMQGSEREYVTPLNAVGTSAAKGKYKVVVNYRYDNEPHYQVGVYYFNDGSLPVLDIFLITLGVILIGSLVFILATKTRRRNRK